MCAIGVYFVLADAIAKMADVIAMRGLLADVTAMWLVLLPLLFVCLGRCYSLADVIAWRLMELPTVGMGGRWNSHWVNVLVAILVFCARPHPICVADGICLCFYLEMGQ